MHCPNCGTKASIGQKFCRACGFGLEKVEQLIADQRTGATEQTIVTTGRLSDDWSRKMEKRASRALFALGGVLVNLMIWAIIAKVMIEEGKIFEGGILLLILTVAVLAAYLGYLRSERKNAASNPLNQQHRLPQAQETAKMPSEPNAEMGASVTEQTTSRLEEKLESR